MTSSRNIQTPLLERRAAKIEKLLTEVAALKKRVAELEAELEAARTR
jgi:outer membrane murein-binding lipoprotein Lpp